MQDNLEASHVERWTFQKKKTEIDFIFPVIILIGLF